MSSMELAHKVASLYRNALLEDSKAGWKKYTTQLRKLAKEVDARSTDALENWALDYVFKMRR